MDLDSDHETRLPWTGERYIPQVTGQIQLEHVHRYLFAREYAKEKDVLDIACGEGYGSAILANTARSVIGVDIAAEVVRHAALRYQRDNVQFRHGSCVEIPLDTHSIDLVVSFETIEHLDEHEALMSEIKRVLRPEGVLIISSPDKKEYSMLPKYRNPFHVRELFKEELEDLIRAYFKDLALFSQRIVYGSGILPESGAFPATSYDIKDSGLSYPGLARPKYLIALASDAALPLLSGGLLEQTVEESENVKRRTEFITQLEDKIGQLKEQLCTQVTQSTSKVRRLEEEVARVNLALAGESPHSSSANPSQRPLPDVGSELMADLFDERYYLEKNPSVANPGIATFQHYRTIGWREGGDPNPFFDTRWYLERNPEVISLGLDPLEHYCRYGWRQGLSPGPHFDSAWYLKAYPDVAQADMEPLTHYLKSGLVEGRWPDAGSALIADLFDERYYLEKNPSVSSIGSAPFQHYRTIGWREGLDPNPFFDTRWYLQSHPEVVSLGLDPLEHYCRYGWRQGLSPSPHFDSTWYLRAYPDVAQAEMEPLTHYLKSGLAEGRWPDAGSALIADLFDEGYYLEKNPSVASIGSAPFQHYRTIGWHEGLDPNPFFDTRWYLQSHPEAVSLGLDPLEHYCRYGWRQGLSPSPHFDSAWYLRAYPDVAQAEMEPLTHYLKSGLAERRWPDAGSALIADLFDEGYYLEKNPSVASIGSAPFQHYRTIGWRDGLNPNPFFDTRWYLQSHPEAVSLGLDPLEHYCRYGWRQGHSPGPHFDSAWYLKAYPDVAQAEMEPLTHYLKSGLVEGRWPYAESALIADLFDERYYLQKNPSVVNSGIAPFEHYRTIGWREGLDPNPFFDTRWYLERHPDAVSLGSDPISHYCRYSWREGLFSLSPHFDSAWYLKAYPDVAAAEMEPLTHYLKWGLAHGRFPRSLDRELAESSDRSLAKWIDERCTQFLTSSTEKEFSATFRETLITKIGCALAAMPTENPTEVSIIVPVYNHVDFTLMSVASVLMSDPRRSFELIVVDDVSTDETQAIFEGLPKPIRYLRWNHNHGFLKSCNAGARYADGKYLVFLNNDTIVFPRWLDSLIETLENQPDAGLVGSKLLFANGRLQEAGGIIFNDASGGNFGRDDDPFRPEYNYLRQVDYCSGCSIGISRDLWTKLGGFDERFAPAYYEDADLCFRIRELGMKVFYQPLSKLIHFEGVSSGTSTSSGVKAYQETNRPKFFDRWSSTLRGHGTGKNLARLADRYSRGRILVVDSVVPTPDQDAGSVGTFNFLRILKQLNKRVTFVPADLTRNNPYAGMLEKIGVECLCYPTVSSLHEAIIHVGPEIEFAFLHRVQVAKSIIDLLRCHAPNAKIIFNTIDLHFLREKREADLTGGRWRHLRAENTKRDELEVICKADATIVLNESERILLNELSPAATVYHISPPIEIPTVSVSWDSRRDIVFVGGFSHPPNTDAILYFIREVWPILRDQGFSDRFLIVGSGMPAAIKSLGTDHIIARGYVEDLAEAFVTARLSVAPLRFGAGLKGKVASSLGYGVPCVTTSIGVEGSGLLNGVNILVGDTPQNLASHILRLYSDRQLWTELSQNGLRFFRDHYSLESIKPKFEQLMAALV